MIEFRDSLEGISEKELEGFFAGWAKQPSPWQHLAILSGSQEVVVAFDTEAGRVVGFVTAISDSVLMAHVPLLEVLPEYRRRGIGSELMRRLLDRLSGYYGIDVVCDDELRPFYERFGLQPARAMIKRNVDR